MHSQEKINNNMPKDMQYSVWAVSLMTSNLLLHYVEIFWLRISKLKMYCRITDKLKNKIITIIKVLFFTPQCELEKSKPWLMRQDFVDFTKCS